LSYADLAAAEDAAKQFEAAVPQEVSLTPLEQWKVLGTSVPRPNRQDLVTGAHQFPSDVRRPGMLYGKVLRPPSYGAKLTAVDVAPAKAIAGVAAVHDGSFAGVAASNSYIAQQALDALEDTAKWETAPHPNSADLYDHLRRRAQGGMPANPFTDEMSRAARALRQTYTVAYVQHAPMEPRAAVAEWEGDRLTVWTATQNPFGVRRELAGAFRIPEEQVRVIVPDFGGGFGGKHTGECAVEAARLAKGAGKPVSLVWTREEEFTWAYFRPAAVIDAEAALDAGGKLACWHFVNVNSGGSSIDTPYRAGKAASRFVQSEPPLRHGSYRALAATANTFARECFMDELAEAAGTDPLAFRLAHLDNPRLRAVLEEAAKRFDFTTRFAKKQPGVGVGIACGTEKNSFVASCAEVAADAKTGAITVRRLCTAYECGKIVNPANLVAQVQGGVIQALGPALREEIRFENGRVTNAAFSRYEVPRFADVPPVLDVHLIDRPDLPPVGAGETPLIAVAPAIANAVHHATGVRVREMPMRLKKA
jgi:isoquinoline 1-oxidoreductase